MRMFEAATVITIVVIALSVGYAIFQKIRPGVIPPDNAVEEIAEEILEAEGFGDIDLTPSSKE